VKSQVKREEGTPSPAAAAEGWGASASSRFTWHACWHAFASLPARLLVLLVRGYQKFVSPALPPSCRFYPSCSQYALEAVQKHGALRGSWLATRRLLRCHPFHPGGVDPVP
jgi:hypothetical protein